MDLSQDDDIGGMSILRSRIIPTALFSRAFTATGVVRRNFGSSLLLRKDTPGSESTNNEFSSSESVLGDFNDINHPNRKRDWTKSFYGVGSQPFEKEVAEILMKPINKEDIEVKPDGLLYLPEIKYRRIMNRAFGPGGWALAPRGPHSVTSKNISREYALICHGRFVSQARGEQDYFDPNGLATAAEGCKSNALLRCCKDLGVASELWDPVFVGQFKSENCVEVNGEHVVTKKRRKLWRLVNRQLEYPFREV
ncbi:mitochondrial genome maintenance MGM101 [Basidiobolus meristosporus CBS 931.73]|uniref:Mitochondrial genome maintenance protein MGM101 n=1 Tax=Basidiobolus meristosporus CBS 931.73 TaxID=1314790 RepID=A0A1Y1YV74_9FUNG|nr:mitochondrial genome maintenance MGM101 [Basidiobolus meristosporus CBS 931.73]|eukprot:ORY01938.1 mitochondrial genome maintenance MGM101 [Basidiobolus meristosporus CBS 931.73]